VKPTTHFYVVSTSSMMELYLRSRIRLHGVVFNYVQGCIFNFDCLHLVPSHYNTHTRSLFTNFKCDILLQISYHLTCFGL
jgi:hypothetical protein